LKKERMQRKGTVPADGVGVSYYVLLQNMATKSFQKTNQATPKVNRGRDVVPRGLGCKTKKKGVMERNKVGAVSS